jgi:glycosyltransferase involved in cell wall biosynthesis
MLAEALRSVWEQDSPPWEVVVVDDAGNGCGQAGVAAAGTGNAPVRVVDGAGKGPAAARNRGLTSTLGALVAFLDDDDTWAPEKLSRQVSWFARRPRLGVLGTGATSVGRDAPTSLVSGSRMASPRSLSLRSVARGNRLVMSSVMARRECLLDVGGFDESLTLAQDWDLWLRIAEAGWEMAALDEPLATYRRHQGQRSANRIEMRRWECEVLVRARVRGRLAEAAPTACRRLAWAHARLGRLLVREGEVAQGQEELRRSMGLFVWNPVVWAATLRCLAARRSWEGVSP